MSDHWETFPCTLGERLAWISYDHGVRKEINALPFANCARFKVKLKAPDAQGFPQREELLPLERLETTLTRRVEQWGGISIGRITVNGARYFFFYTAADAEQAKALAHSLTRDTGYQIVLTFDLDVERKAYWNELFPTDDDWQAIKDLRVERTLREQGDPLIQPRLIEHWLYFRTRADRERFIARIPTTFEIIREFDSPDSRPGHFGLLLGHTGLPEYTSISKITLPLVRAAREYGGQYEGWEAQACKP